jgi:large subunit ribosomal protein L4
MPVARLFSSDGTEQGEIDLEESVFGISANAHAMYEAQKMYRAGQRQGTAAAQTRSQVSYAGKKIYRQKGLGRARMGSRRSPVRIGGGRAHGPKPRSYSYRIPKKVRRLALKSVLSTRAQSGSVLVIDALEFDAPRTRQMVSVLSNMKVDDRKCLVLMDRSDEAVYKSCRNIPDVHINVATDTHVHEILRSDCLIFTREGLKQVEEALKS